MGYIGLKGGCIPDHSGGKILTPMAYKSHTVGRYRLNSVQQF